jgi:hypothetical protein
LLSASVFAETGSPHLHARQAPSLCQLEPSEPRCRLAINLCGNRIPMLSAQLALRTPFPPYWLHWRTPRLLRAAGRQRINRVCPVGLRQPAGVQCRRRARRTRCSFRIALARLRALLFSRSSPLFSAVALWAYRMRLPRPYLIRDPTVGRGRRCARPRRRHCQRCEGNLFHVSPTPRRAEGRRVRTNILATPRGVEAPKHNGLSSPRLPAQMCCCGPLRELAFAFCLRTK